MAKNMVKEAITTKMEISILVIGWRIKKMGMGFSNTQVEQYMMASGLTIEQPIKERLSMPIKISMKVIFWMEKNTEKEFIIIKQEVNTKDSGWMIRSMDMEW